jgi:hypothetical protein
VSDDEALKQAIEKDEEDRTDADWELLANALETDKSHLEAVADEEGKHLEE